MKVIFSVRNMISITVTVKFRSSVGNRLALDLGKYLISLRLEF